MKRLMCLLCIVGCGFPRPDMPPYAGTVDGIDYYLDSEAHITLNEASSMVRATIELLQEDPAKTQGLSIAWTTRQFQCANAQGPDGCYIEDLDKTIILLVGAACPLNVPIAHEFWHLFHSSHNEPDEAAIRIIIWAQEEMEARMRREYSPFSTCSEMQHQ
jgi:hypothetical protein